MADESLRLQYWEVQTQCMVSACAPPSTQRLPKSLLKSWLDVGLIICQIKIV